MPNKPTIPLPSDQESGDGLNRFPVVALEAEPPQRVVRIASSLDSIRAIVADRRGDYGAFLDEDHGEHGKAEKELIKALFKAIPE
jgi:hypothetical protein